MYPKIEKKRIRGRSNKAVALDRDPGGDIKVCNIVHLLLFDIKLFSKCFIHVFKVFNKYMCIYKVVFFHCIGLRTFDYTLPSR